MDASTNLALAEVADRLYREFGEQVPLEEVIAVVRDARSDIDIASPSGMAEVVERLARVRLAERAPRRDGPPLMNMAT
jgi:hypothetical protein